MQSYSKFSTPTAGTMAPMSVPDDSPDNAIKDRVQIAEAKAAVKTLLKHVNSLDEFAVGIGAQLMAEITEPIDDTATAAAISDPAWKPSSSHLPTTPDAYASRAQGTASASHAASYAFTTLPAWDPMWSPCDHTCDKSHSISSAVHRLAGQLVEHGVPSRVALVLARNGVEPKDLASTPLLSLIHI